MKRLLLGVPASMKAHPPFFRDFVWGTDWYKPIHRDVEEMLTGFMRR